MIEKMAKISIITPKENLDNLLKVVVKTKLKLRCPNTNIRQFLFSYIILIEQHLGIKNSNAYLRDFEMNYDEYLISFEKFGYNVN